MASGAIKALLMVAPGTVEAQTSGGDLDACLARMARFWMHQIHHVRLIINRTSLLPGLVWCLLTSVSLGMANPIVLGTRLELFVDDYLVENLTAVEFHLHHPVKAPRPVSPLPEKHMVTVIKDGDRYRAWYRDKDPAYTGPTHTGNAGETVHYAESRDGHEWTFPVMRLHEIDGNLENNAILARLPPFLTNFMPFLDPRPGVDAAERYKAVAGYPGTGNKVGLDEPGRGLFTFVSPDGIHWTKRNEAIRYRPEWRHAFDSPNVAFWSEAEQLYVCYFRTWSESGRVRSISRATSPDFVQWSDPVEMKPNLPGEHLYTNGTHPYARAPHIYVALPTRFVPLEADSADRVNNNVTDVIFMTTRAGSEHYDRTFTEAYIRPGRDPARWLNRANYAAQNVIQTGSDELSIWHRSGDRYTLRLDGFISLRAGAARGEVVTKSFTFSGGSLVLNYATAAAGGIQVEIQDPSGTPIPGYALEDSILLRGDQINGVATWRDRREVSDLAGLAVRLRFVLQEADLYSLQFQ